MERSHQQTLARYKELVGEYSSAVSRTMERQEARNAELAELAKQAMSLAASYKELSEQKDGQIERAIHDGKKLRRELCAQLAMAEISRAEIGFLLEKTVPALIEFIAENWNVRETPQFRDTLDKAVRFTLPLSADADFRDKARAKILAEIDETEKRNEPYKLSADQMNRVVDIVKALGDARPQPAL